MNSLDEWLLVLALALIAYGLPLYFAWKRRRDR